ncbi:MAG: hypothetical protein IAE81_15690 [Caldilineaceae bacterium]|nr:hypothetical protein [Caldilineaceae bacterium]
MDLAFWRDISLFYLLSMQLVVTLLTAVALYFVVRGAMIARRKATSGVKLARYYVGIGRTQTAKFADKATTPLVRSHGAAARGDAIFRSLLPGRQAPSSPTDKVISKVKE